MHVYLCTKYMEKAEVVSVTVGTRDGSVFLHPRKMDGTMPERLTYRSSNRH